jgi:signal peptide peptidase SppA
METNTNDARAVKIAQLLEQTEREQRNASVFPIDGLLAIDPRALPSLRDGTFTRGWTRDAKLGLVPASLAKANAAPAIAPGGIAIVDVMGPLLKRGITYESWFGTITYDGYDTILQRIQNALNDRSVRAVVLRLDSPGGQAAGCFEAVRAIRAAAAASDKPLVGFADEMACSAAFALASACDQIVVPDAGILGSVGVIQTLVEYSKMLDEAGIKVNYITSGDRKADGAPYQPLSKDARDAFQSEVDHLAAIFAQEVAVGRGMTPKAVLSLEAGVFLGAEAVAKKLADRVGTVADAIALASDLAASRKTSGRNAAATSQGATKMKTVLAQLGLKEDATEAEVLAAVTKMQNDVRESEKTLANRASILERFLAAVDQKDAETALGAIAGLKATAATATELKARLDALDAKAEKAERDALIEKGKEEGKLSPAQLEKWVPTQSTASLRGYLETAQPSIPLAANGATKKEPESNAGMAKEWEALSPKERAHLFHTDPARYEALKNAAKKKSGE